MMSVLAQSCGLFELRDPEPPNQTRSVFIPPTTPEIVTRNLISAVSEKNSENYLKCFADTNYTPRRFTYTPDASSMSQYPVFNNWDINKERNYYNNLIALTLPSATSFLSLPNVTINSTADTAVADSDYLLIYEHNRSTVAKTLHGKLRFYMGLDSRNLWSIHNWIDYKVNENDTTWSVLKANFSN
jgi:hypothetical protein